MFFHVTLDIPSRDGWDWWVGLGIPPSIDPGWAHFAGHLPAGQRLLAVEVSRSELEGFVGRAFLGLARLAGHGTARPGFRFYYLPRAPTVLEKWLGLKPHPGYSLDVFTNACYFYLEDTQAFATDGCTVSRTSLIFLPTFEEEVVFEPGVETGSGWSQCHCTHLTSFASGLQGVKRNESRDFHETTTPPPGTSPLM